MGYNFGEVVGTTPLFFPLRCQWGHLEHGDWKLNIAWIFALFALFKPYYVQKMKHDKIIIEHVGNYCCEFAVFSARENTVK